MFYNVLRYELRSLEDTILNNNNNTIILLQNAVASVIILVKWLIPDVPRSLRDQIRREHYITNEIIIKQEALRATATCEEKKKQRK